MVGQLARHLWIGDYLVATVFQIQYGLCESVLVHDCDSWLPLEVRLCPDTRRGRGATDRCPAAYDGPRLGALYNLSNITRALSATNSGSLAAHVQMTDH